MARRPPVLSLALPSETGRVLSIQSHTVQVLCKILFRLISFFVLSFFFPDSSGTYLSVFLHSAEFVM
jgi:hypothetical protein